MKYEFRTIGPIAPALAIPPVIELDEAKDHLEVDFDHHDAKITGLILVAQDFIERRTSRALTPRVLELVLGGFPWAPRQLSIPIEPVRAINAVAYTDGGGATVNLAGADWRWSESSPRLLLPAIATNWPTALDEFGSVRIELEAGYDEGLAPPSLIGAVKLMLTHLYEDAGGLGSEMPPGVDTLCAPYRLRAI